jgi:hypothetical protein
MSRDRVSGLKYIILHAIKVDETGEVVDDYHVPVLFPVQVAGKHGAESVRKQMLLDSHRSVSKINGGYVGLSHGRVTVYGKFTDSEDGIELEPGPEDIAIISEHLQED